MHLLFINFKLFLGSFFNWAFTGLFLVSSFTYILNTVGSKFILPMSGFEPQVSVVGSDRSTNCTTTTTHIFSVFFILFVFQEEPKLVQKSISFLCAIFGQKMLLIIKRSVPTYLPTYLSLISLLNF